MVPVLDSNKKPLMPCSEKRARKMLDQGKAKAYWKQGVFCIILQKEPCARNYQDVVVGIDPGSKREGYTVATETKVVLNILSDTPSEVKKNVETRHVIRNTRRQRRTPYRECRYNRKVGGIPPSTKARWGAKLRLFKFLTLILPVTDVNIEDIKAVTKKGQRNWNASFSPLEYGKNQFYEQIKDMGVNLFKTAGYETFEWRNSRNFKKTKGKLKDIWEAHCVDSHVLCEKTFGCELEPFKGMYRINFLKFSRRQIHVQNPIKGGKRKQYGGTVSLGLARGCLVTHPKYGKCYIGGTSNHRLSLYNLEGIRLAQNAKKEDCKVLTNLKWRSAFLSD